MYVCIHASLHVQQLKRHTHTDKQHTHTHTHTHTVSVYAKDVLSVFRRKAQQRPVASLLRRSLRIHHYLFVGVRMSHLRSSVRDRGNREREAWRGRELGEKKRKYRRSNREREKERNS
jgi:hypothetical protein